MQNLVQETWKTMVSEKSRNLHLALYLWELLSGCFEHMEINWPNCKYRENKSAIGKGKVLQSFEAGLPCSH